MRWTIVYVFTIRSLYTLHTHTHAHTRTVSLYALQMEIIFIASD